MLLQFMTMPPNYALHRTRPSRSGCNPFHPTGSQAGNVALNVRVEIVGMANLEHPETLLAAEGAHRVAYRMSGAGPRDVVMYPGLSPNSAFGGPEPRTA
jgi:hypothetical protein